MPITNEASTMPLQTKLYQLIISRIDGDRLTDETYVQKQRDFVAKGIGGFILFGGKRDVVTAFVREMQSAASIQLFIASDIERGTAQQIEDGTPFPSQMAVAAAVNIDRHEDRNLLSDALRALAAEAAAIGITMPLLPVLDVNSNPDNPIVCTRAFSDDPELVAAFGIYYIKTLQANSMITCAKHFPGHGDTATDSHIELPVIRKTKNELMECELFPFVAAIKAGVRSIMIGHLLVPELDDRPASISRRIVTDLLRTEFGFDGLIMTDALNMHALAGVTNLPVACMQAGIDILLHPVDADATVAELEKAITDGVLAESIIDAAIARILREKSEPRTTNTQKTGHPGAVAARLAGKSITLVDQILGTLPLDDPEKTALVLCGDIAKHDVSPISSAFPTHLTLDEIAAGPEIEATVLFAVFTSVSAWQGSSGLSPDEIERVQLALKKTKQSIVISFGSPYVLQHFTESNALIAAYDASRFAQGALIGCLTGAFGFNGSLPVELGEACEE
jgi:beta-glucosidase-like glycosyl hydrolase